MPRDRFFIGPIQGGLQKDLKPWAIPDDAFELLKNSYNFRGRIRKRFGSYLMNTNVSAAVAQLSSRLRVNLGTTNGAGNLSGTVPGAIFEPGQQFSVGSEIFTVSVLGTPGTMLTTGAATVHTYNTTTGAFVINGAAALTAVYFYPAQPVMGLVNYEDTSINFEPLFAFDTQFAYRFISGAWTRLGTAIWTGNDTNYFWAYNYRGDEDYQTFLFVTNFVAADSIKYWDNDASTWTTLVNRNINATDTIETCRIIIPFQDRLLLLNTVENTGGTDRSFVNRCRYSAIGSSVDTNSWREDIPGNGGFKDAPTKEAIVSAQLLKNRLIVFFERSTWELVYTGNQVLPFQWQLLNSELGVESTFSVIPFDKVALGIGDVGIHACNGVNVERIDNKIPAQVFEIQNEDSGTSRVHGIRDYVSEVVYWSIPTNTNFCNQLLVYNYNNGNWAIFDDSFTCFGYYQPDDALIWENANFEWQEAINAWDDGSFQARYRNVAAGNQQGFVLVVEPDFTRNAPSLQITDIDTGTGEFTVINHNLIESSYILIENSQGITSINDTIYQITRVDADTFTISDANGVQIIPTGSYTGGGTVALVSLIDILTKQYNFYVQTGQTAQIMKIDFMVDKTPNGAITVDTFVSSSSLSLLDDAQATGSLLGNGTLETSAYATVPLESTQTRLWHPMYVSASGDVVQMRLYLSPDQITTQSIAESDFQLHAMIFHAMPGSSRMG
jgi:hypothetical protein